MSEIESGVVNQHHNVETILSPVDYNKFAKGPDAAEQYEFRLSAMMW